MAAGEAAHLRAVLLHDMQREELAHLLVERDALAQPVEPRPALVQRADPHWHARRYVLFLLVVRGEGQRAYRSRQECGRNATQLLLTLRWHRKLTSGWSLSQPTSKEKGNGGYSASSRNQVVPGRSLQGIDGTRASCRLVDERHARGKQARGTAQVPLQRRRQGDRRLRHEGSGASAREARAMAGGRRPRGMDRHEG